MNDTVSEDRLLAAEKSCVCGCCVDNQERRRSNRQPMCNCWDYLEPEQCDCLPCAASLSAPMVKRWGR